MSTATRSTLSNGSALNGGHTGSVGDLSQAEQESLLFELVREIYRRNPGEGIIPLINAQGEWVGNLVSPEQPAADADRLFAEMPPQSRHAIMKPLLDIDFDDALTDEEVQAILKPDSPA
jgi:hypothetical protein